MRFQCAYRTKGGLDMHTWWWSDIREAGYTTMEPAYLWYSFGPVQHAMITRVINARAWREVQRTQIGMALHRRLGAASRMRVIPADMAELISKFL
jgi:hypothetical protein